MLIDRDPPGSALGLDVDDQRKNIRHALRFQRLIQLVDREMIGIHRHDIFRAPGGDSRKHADVAADVPRQISVACAGNLLHELALLRRV